MKKIFMLATSCTIASLSTNSQIVISQIYGGGGNSGATYQNDFIELFNPSANSVNLSGHYIQYSTASGSAFSIFATLSGSVGARSYYLIQFGNTGSSSNGSALPNPDLIATPSGGSPDYLSRNAAKIALTNSNTLITTCTQGGSLPANAVDFVGYGNSANIPNCYLGNSYAPVATNSNTSASIRKSFGSINTNDNGSDFMSGTPNPRNTTIILPLQLLSFSADPKENTVAFTWATANEHNTRYFELEQSFDGREFKSIATIAAAGNSTIEKSYSYTGTLNTAITYYRLKMIDADAKSALSSVIKIAPSKAGFSLGNVYPIPAKTSITVEWNSRTTGATTLILADVSGRTVRALNLKSANGFNRYQLDVNTLSAGQYFLCLKNDLNQVQTIITRQ